MIARRLRQRAQALLGRFASPYRLLSVRSDESGWVLDEEASEIAALARRLGIAAGVDRGLFRDAPQCLHFTSQFVLLDPPWGAKERVSIDMLHGDPSTDPGFRKLHDWLRTGHGRLSRVRVSHSRMQGTVLASGIDPAKVHRIPLGIRLDYFPVQTPESRRRAREAFGLPADAVVFGSFQKDGIGWGDGMEPKPIKGPDVLLAAVRILKQRVPGLHVLLTGPARGFVRAGLEKLGIPVCHVTVDDYRDMGGCFHAVDAYIVSSRDEGGPKAVLEAMAAGVPLVTTRVGQAVDLVRHQENGWMVEAEDAEGLAHWAGVAVSDDETRERVVFAARATAEANSYEAQQAHWAGFFRGYVEWSA